MKNLISRMNKLEKVLDKVTSKKEINDIDPPYIAFKPGVEAINRALEKLGLNPEDETKEEKAERKRFLNLFKKAIRDQKKIGR